ncbi:MAG: hypothetical protein QM755_01885 [Luteolibacter sp.]
MLVSLCLGEGFPLDLGVLGIWFGRGLLRRNRIDRVWVMVFALAGLLLTAYSSLRDWRNGSFATLVGPERTLVMTGLGSFSSSTS